MHAFTSADALSDLDAVGVAELIGSGDERSLLGVAFELETAKPFARIQD